MSDREKVGPEAAESIGVIGGTGEEGRGIALRFSQAGVAAWLGSRSEIRALETAGELNGLPRGGLIGGCSNDDLPDRCTVLFLTVPFAHAHSTLASLSDRLTERHLIIDVTVPLIFEKGPRLENLGGESGSEHIRGYLPERVPLAAAFKTIPAHLLVDPNRRLDCHEFVCGDSAAVRRRALAALAPIADVNWIDAGPLRYCRALEAMTMLVISLNRRYKSRYGRYRMVDLPQARDRVH